MKILPQDLRIDTYIPSELKSDGTHTHHISIGVRILHIPTQIVVQSHRYKNQVKNKEHCLELLQKELEKLMPND